MRIVVRSFIRFPFLNFPCNNLEFCDIHSLYKGSGLALYGKGLVPHHSDEEEGIRKA